MTNRLVHNSTYGYRAMLEWLSLQSPIVVYIFLIFNAMVESIFPPYPSDAFVAVIAFSAGQGHFNPFAIYGATCTGSIAGIMIAYAVAKYHGEAIIQFVSHSFLNRVFPTTLIERVQKKFARHDDVILILNRFLPGVRSAINVAAGISHVKPQKVFSYSLVSVLLWNLFLVMIGFQFGSSWREASSFLRNYNIIVGLVLIVFLVVFSIAYFRRKNNNP